MHVGLGLSFQNLIAGQTDAQVYRNELQLAGRAEQVGFDSVWTPEHHFTDYMLTPNVTQFLSWVAGRTSRVKLGSMVTVLPWHDPLRVAENFTLLDHLSEGRAVLGIGRGLGRVEFDAFRTPMAESRRRFTEYTEAILTGLETGVMEYDGALYKQPRTHIRPGPYASFKGRTFASAISPYSIDLMAKLGVGLMVIAQKPWEMVKNEIVGYRQRYFAVNGTPAPKPILNMFVAVNEDPAEAQRMREVYLQRYARSTVEHYEFGNVGFAEIEGYEYYAGLARNIEKHGLEKFNGFLADLQVWGTPGEVAEKLIKYVDYLDAGALLVMLSYGGMSADVAKRNYDLFVSSVLPKLKRYDVGGDIGVLSSPETAATAAE
ncbi:MAG: alkane 1-monooxygenase [Alphaproteobacteria bacterium 65-37]|nr:LLM class flavin-dependent oxidoreductase [Alphaproteobacteria bacterium]OJU45439.1 MAG: alkane 1-monooxygenase [Alphaproteobacteria bacterium 65-37]